MAIPKNKVGIGDRIKLHVVARWATRPTVWRVVRTVDPVTVRLGGWPNYIVHDHEIIERAKGAQQRATDRMTSERSSWIAAFEQRNLPRDVATQNEKK